MSELDNFKPFDTQTIPADPFEIVRLMRVVNLLMWERKRNSQLLSSGHGIKEFGD